MQRSSVMCERLVKTLKTLGAVQIDGWSPQWQWHDLASAMKDDLVTVEGDIDKRFVIVRLKENIRERFQ
jgi:hypothetical protein